MKRHLERSTSRVNVGSWVWMLVSGALGIGVLLYQPDASDSGTTQRASVETPQTTLAALDRTRATPGMSVGARNIEDIRVGQRVLANNPEVSDAERASWKVPDWSRWIKLTLLMPKPDGSELVIEMLRPEQWVIAQSRFIVDEQPENSVKASVENTQLSQLKRSFVPLCPTYSHFASQLTQIKSSGHRLLGVTIKLDLPELGLTGDAALVDMAPQPTVQTGAGHVVTATFHHSSSDVIDLVVTNADGQCETIGTTSNHPFWSVDRQEYVQAGTLQSGERLLTYAGNTNTVASKVRRSGPQPVYNLEVHGEHVYFVGENGLLVHNAKSYRISIGKNDGRIRVLEGKHIRFDADNFAKLQEQILRNAVSSNATVDLPSLRRAIEQSRELGGARLRLLASEMSIIKPGQPEWKAAARLLKGTLPGHGADYRVATFQNGGKLMNNLGPLDQFPAHTVKKYPRGFEIHDPEITGSTPWHDLPHIKFKVESGDGHIYF